MKERKFPSKTYSGLEAGNLLIGEGVRLGNDGNQVDLGVKAAHHLNVKGFEGVAGRLDEEDASMDSVVNNVHAVDLVLGIEIGIVALLNVVGDGAPGLVIVDKVTKSGSVNNSQAKTDTSFLDIGTDGLNSDSLGDNVEARSLALLGRVQRRVEESVYQGRLAKARFTCTRVRTEQKKMLDKLTNNHDVEVEPLADTLTVPLVRKVGESNVAGKLASNNVPSILYRSRGRNVYGYRVRRDVPFPEVCRDVKLAVSGRSGRHRGWRGAAVGSWKNVSPGLQLGSCKVR